MTICRRGAFNLVELLVVLSIITLLIALLLPPLRRALDAAEMVQCASRLRQRMTVQHVYAYDHQGWVFMNGTYPPSSWPKGGGTGKGTP